MSQSQMFNSVSVSSQSNP